MNKGQLVLSELEHVAVKYGVCLGVFAADEEGVLITGIANYKQVKPRALLAGVNHLGGSVRALIDRDAPGAFAECVAEMEAEAPEVKGTPIHKTGWMKTE